MFYGCRNIWFRAAIITQSTVSLITPGHPMMNPGRFGPIPVRSGRFGPGRFGPISGVSRFGPVGAGRFGPIS